jgi:hypothetical protein
VELVSTSDEYTDLKPGDKGTVEREDAVGTLHIRWDSGSRLGLIPGEDHFRFIDGRRES